MVEYHLKRSNIFILYLLLIIKISAYVDTFAGEIFFAYSVKKKFFLLLLFQMDDYDCTFNCSGKINFADWQLNNTGLFTREVENIFIPKRNYSFSDEQVRLFDCLVPSATAVLNLKHYINCME